MCQNLLTAIRDLKHFKSLSIFEGIRKEGMRGRGARGVEKMEARGTKKWKGNVPNQFCSRSCMYA